MKIKAFTFNPFQENTYVLSDGQYAIIIDPGCSEEWERKELVDYITSEELIPMALVNTHCHIDHVLGNKFVAEKYNLALQAHEGEKLLLSNQPVVANMYGIPYTPSPDIAVFLSEGEDLAVGQMTFKIIFTPGHSPASICLYHEESQQLIAGDVLFKDSIGRTDLPGGDYQTLVKSIKRKLFELPDQVTVYPGHGPTTTIGYEKKNNPFVGEKPIV